MTKQKKKAKEKKGQTKKTKHVTVVQHQGALVQPFLFGFLPNLGRKHFGLPGKKTLGPHQFFFSSPPFNQTLAKNIFSPFFSHFFSILPIPPSTRLDKRMEKWKDRKWKGNEKVSGQKKFNFLFVCLVEGVEKFEMKNSFVWLSRKMGGQKMQFV